MPNSSLRGNALGKLVGIGTLGDKVSAAVDQICSAGENRSTFSSMLLCRHCCLISIPVFEGGVYCLKTGREKEESSHSTDLRSIFTGTAVLSKTALTLLGDKGPK